MKIWLIRSAVAASFLMVHSVMIAFAEDAHAFPNPFVAKQNSSETISFTPLPNSGTIKIYTIDGVEIRSIDIPPSGIASWDTKNANGKSVVTGVYYFHVKGDNKETIGKVVIIR